MSSEDLNGAAWTKRAPTPASTGRVRNAGRRASKIQPTQVVGTTVTHTVDVKGRAVPITKYHVPGTVIRMAKRGGGVVEYTVDRFGCLRRT